MNNDNPYSPPSSKIGQPDGESQRLRKRPTSHKIVLFIFGVSAVFRTFLFTKMHATTFLINCEMFYLHIPFVALMFFRFSRATYYITGVSLALFVFLTALRIVDLARPKNSLSGGPMIPETIVMFLVTYLLVLLCSKYVFGRASREYYGFPVPPRKP